MTFSRFNVIYSPPVKSKKTKCLLRISLSCQLLYVDLWLGGAIGGNVNCSVIRAGELIKSCQILIRQSVGADGAERSGRASVRCKEL